MSAPGRRVTGVDYALILASVALGATGQVLMKLGTGGLADASLSGTLSAAFTEPLVLLGVASYAFSSVIWLVVLSRVPLSTAYPFGALSYVLVVAVALMTGETVTALRWAGVAFIVGGIWLVGTGATNAPSTEEGAGA